jgi:hypothetical protein
LFFNEAEQAVPPNMLLLGTPQSQAQWQKANQGFHLHTSEFEPRTFFSGPKVPHRAITSEVLQGLLTAKEVLLSKLT